jgi:hypothetical protein
MNGAGVRVGHLRHEINVKTDLSSSEDLAAVGKIEVGSCFLARVGHQDLVETIASSKLCNESLSYRFVDEGCLHRSTIACKEVCFDPAKMFR